MVAAAAIAGMLVAATAVAVVGATAEDKAPTVAAVGQRVEHQEMSASTHTRSGSQRISLCLRKTTSCLPDRLQETRC